MTTQASPTQRVAAVRARLDTIGRALASLDATEREQRAQDEATMPELRAAEADCKRAEERLHLARAARRHGDQSGLGAVTGRGRLERERDELEDERATDLAPGPASDRPPPAPAGRVARGRRPWRRAAAGARPDHPQRARLQRRARRRLPAPARPHAAARRRRRRHGHVSTPAPRPLPQPGESWAVSDAVFLVVAAGDVTVLDVQGDRVTFSDSRGAVGTFSVSTFRGLYQPAGAPPS